MSYAAPTLSPAIAELREFASFEPEERAFIERSLDIALGRMAGAKQGSRPVADQPAIRQQFLAYRELRSLRGSVPGDGGFEGLSDFIGALVRISAQDLAQEKLGSFSAYRFLYERLLGAAARPFLPAAFCAAAALPQLRPERRRLLLQSLSEAAATAPGWSEREPSFIPERMVDMAA